MTDETPRFTFGAAGEETPIPFEVNGDLLYAAAAIPGEEYGRLVSLFASIPKQAQDGDPAQAEQTLRVILEMLELFLLPESSEILANRLRSKESPISVQQIMDIATTFIQEVYSESKDGDQRPTKPTSA
jgi:hypothetical protein